MNQNNISSERLHTIFEHELKINGAIFLKEIFYKDPFKGYLFEEFKTAELKPCFWLYREKYVSQKQYEEGLNKRNYNTEFEYKIRRIEQLYYKRLDGHSLKKEFYCPDIYKTPTVLILSEIWEAYEKFTDPDFESDSGKLSLYVEIISGNINKIGKEDLRLKVIDELITGDDNFQVLMRNDVGTLKNWNDRKLLFNHLLRQQCEIQQKPDRSFPEYLNHPKPAIFAMNIINEFPSIVGSGTHSAALFSALDDLGLFKNRKNDKTMFRTMTAYFGTIGNYSGFSKYLKDSTDKQKEKIKEFKLRINRIK